MGGTCEKKDGDSVNKMVDNVEVFGRRGRGMNV